MFSSEWQKEMVARQYGASYSLGLEQALELDLQFCVLLSIVSREKAR